MVPGGWTIAYEQARDAVEGACRSAANSFSSLGPEIPGTLFWVWGFASDAWGFGCGAESLRLRVWGAGLRVWDEGLELRISGAGLRVWG